MVQIAKFFKSIKRTVDDVKTSIDEEMRISELKEEALQYKKQLDEATQKIGKETAALTSLDDLDEPVGSTHAGERRIDDMLPPEAQTVEPNREKITFPKKSKVVPPADKPENDAKESHV
jgi:sec-independent protein translocase protein TatB